MDLTDISSIETKPLDGVSIRAVLEGGENALPDRRIYAQSADGTTTGVWTQHYRAGGHAGGIYDMHMDIGQYNDLRGRLSDEYDEFCNVDVHLRGRK